MDSTEETQTTRNLAPTAQGVWLIDTRWLAPILLNEIRMKVSVQISALGKVFTREYEVTGSDIYGAFNLLVQLLSQVAASYNVPLADPLRLNDPTNAGLQATLQIANDYNRAQPHIN